MWNQQDDQWEGPRGSVIIDSNRDGAQIIGLVRRLPEPLDSRGKLFTARMEGPTTSEDAAAFYANASGVDLSQEPRSVIGGSEDGFSRKEAGRQDLMGSWQASERSIFD